MRVEAELRAGGREHLVAKYGELIGQGSSALDPGCEKERGQGAGEKKY